MHLIILSIFDIILLIEGENMKHLKSKKTVSLMFFVISFFIFVSGAKADSVEGTITGDQVSFRSEPRTGSTVYASLYKGARVSLVSTYAVKGIGCDAGWYNIYYNSKSGYVCGSYLSIPGTASYDRPWVSPKKAIIGGAKFISSGYISKGQNTSYLKKFQVNPNSYYNVYTHQYMANLQAPTSEASTSFNTYKANGLLSLPLVFEIPIFNNMPYQTSHPRDGAFTDGQWNITDPAFEKLLDAEGFPDTYRVKLRLLHSQHPNWIFKSLKTNLDFWDSVYIEKNVSSISSCSQCYQQPLESTEKGWYIANVETVSYYLDPRNFLKESAILMFEDLSYRKEYNASAVGNILKTTFMNGFSALDNELYQDIFVDAGIAANISPVYLASLARQEAGNKLTNTTSGARFTYEGQTYEGFYNFFNIGAYGSATNPALAGLVYASLGSSKNSDGIYVGGIPSDGGSSGESGGSGELEPPKFDISQVVKQMEVKQTGNYIVNVNPSTTTGTLRKKTADGNVTFKKENGTTLADWEVLGTGTQIIYKDGTKHTIVVYGDLTGDGVVNSADLLRLRQYLLGQVNLNGAYYESARTAHSNTINSADLLKLRQHLLGNSYISQV